MALKKPALPEPPNASVLQRAKDLGLDVFGHTPVAMGEALVGLANIPTMGYAGKGLQEIGYDPKKLHEMINSQMSEERQYEQSKQSETYDESIWKGLGYSLSNPAPAIGTIIQSIPLMYGGRGIAQGLMKAAPKMVPALAGGIGEGTIAGGMTLEQIRQSSEEGTLTPKQYALGMGAGVVTGALGYAGGKLAGKLGLQDIDFPQGTPAKDVIASGAKKSLARRIGEGAIQEGLFEELPQSMQEQIAQNLATGKEWDEGLNEAAGLGLLTGSVMGGVMQGKDSMKSKMLHALISRETVASEKEKSNKETVDKMLADKKAVETTHQEAVVQGKAETDLLGDSPSLDEQRVEQKLSESQQEAAQGIQGATTEAEVINEAIDASVVTETESAVAHEIKTMLAPFKKALGANEEFEANIIFAARQDLSKQEFVDLLVSVYGDKGRLAAKVIYPKLQKIIEEMTYEAQQAVAFHTSIEPINIYSGGNNEFKGLSNFSTEFPVQLGETSYPSVEHAYQAAKAMMAGDQEAAQRILAAKTGAQVKSLAKGIKGLDSQKWDAVAPMVIEDMIRKSLEQNPAKMRLLLKTGNSKITHNFPNGKSMGKWSVIFPQILEKIRAEQFKKGKNAFSQQEEIPLPEEQGAPSQEMSDEDFLAYAQMSEEDQKPFYTPEPITEHTDVIQTAEGGGIKFEESNQKGYAPRTKANASADATIAIAFDFNSAGEKLTKKLVKEQGKTYIPLNLKVAINAARVKRVVDALNRANAKTINIAGNGLHTLTLSKSGHTQATVDKYVYELLEKVINHPDLKVEISEVRSGGQTGIDEAGVKAAAKLGLNARVLAPNGWVYRDAQGKDHKGKVNFLTRFRVISREDYKKAKGRERGVAKHAQEQNLRVQDIDRNRSMSKEDEAMKWEHFESENLDQKTMQYIAGSGDLIPFDAIDSYETTIEEDQPEGTMFVRVKHRVTGSKPGTFGNVQYRTSPRSLVSKFDHRQHLAEKSRKLPRKNKQTQEDRDAIKEALLIRNKIDETDPIVDEETREFLKQVRAKEILEEGLIDGEPLGDKSIDSPRNRIDITKVTNKAEIEKMINDPEGRILEGEDAYHDGDVPKQPKTYIGESSDFDAESLDFFLKMRRFKNVKKLSDVETIAKNQAALNNRITEIIDVMKNSVFLRGSESETEEVYGYANYIGEMIKEVAQTHELRSIVEFIKQEEGIMTLSELQGIPQSLEDLMEVSRSGGLETFELIKRGHSRKSTDEFFENEMTKTDREMFISRVWHAISGAAHDAEMLDENRKAAAVFVKDPRGVIKFVRDFFDYGSKEVPSQISVKEMAALAKAYRKEFGAYVDIEVMNVIVQATKDQRLIDYLKTPESKMNQFKGDHDISKLYPYTPETLLTNEQDLLRINKTLNDEKLLHDYAKRHGYGSQELPNKELAKEALEKVKKQIESKLQDKEKAEETTKKLKKSAYEAFKDITTAITQGTIDVGVATGFFRALNKLSNVGHSTSARLYDPAKIVGIMSKDPLVPKSFHTESEIKMANGKIVKKEVPFETRKRIVQELWSKSRFEYGTWIKTYVKGDPELPQYSEEEYREYPITDKEGNVTGKAKQVSRRRLDRPARVTDEDYEQGHIGTLNPENIDAHHGEGSIEIQDIEKEIKLRDTSFEYQGFAETRNVAGYRVWTATVVESVTYESPNTGKTITVKEPTPAQMELVKKREVPYKTKTKDIPFMKPKEITALKKTRVVTQSAKSQAVGDSKVYQVILNKGKPVNMNMVEILRNQRAGEKVQILGDAATYSVRLYNTKEKEWVNKRLRWDQLAFLKNKILTVHAKTLGVPVAELTEKQVVDGLNPYMRHIEVRGQQQIFPWDQTTVLAPLYDLALGQGIITVEALQRQFSKISFLKNLNAEITAAKGKEGNEELIDTLYKLKNEVSERIAAFNLSIKGKLTVNSFHASMVVDPQYFDRLAEELKIDKMGGEDMFNLFMQSGMNIQHLNTQARHMKLQQDIAETDRLFISIPKTEQERETQVREYVREKLPERLHEQYESLLKNRADIIKVEDSQDARTLVVALQVHDLIDSAVETVTIERDGQKVTETSKVVGDRLKSRMAEDKKAREIVKENWEKLEESLTRAANLMARAGQQVPAEMIFTNKDGKLREKTTLSAFEQELVDQNPSLTVGRLFSKKAQIFYKAIAKAFGADLVIVHDQLYTSRYISKASDGKAKIIININSPTSFTRIFGHELFHHVVAKSAPAEYKAFRQAVMDVAGEDQLKAAVHQMMRQRNVQVEGNWETDANTFESLLKMLAEKHISEEEVMAEIFASMVHDKGFYDALAKTFVGRGLAAKIITRLIAKVEEVNKVALREAQDGYSYEAGLLLDHDQMKEMHKLFADFLGEALFEPADPRSGVERYMAEKEPHKIKKTKRGDKSLVDDLDQETEAAIEEAVEETTNQYNTASGKTTLRKQAERLANKKEWFQGTWKKIFPEGTKSRKEVMGQMEVHIDSTIQWLKKNKPKWAWADWMVNEMAIKYGNMIAFGANSHVATAQYQLKHHKKAFKGMNKEDRIYLHDLITKGIHTKTITDPATGIVTQKSVMIPREKIDITTENGQKNLIALGVTQEQIDAFLAFKQVADKTFVDLKKLMPELDYNEFHFGQSVKWFRKDGKALDDNFDFKTNPEYSRFEGRKQYLKGRNEDLSIYQIEKEYNLDYLHLDPMRMMLDYVRDVNQLIYFHKAIGQGLKTGDVREYYEKNQNMANVDGFLPLADNGTKTFQNQAMPNGIKILLGDPAKGVFYKEEETGQDKIFESSEEAEIVRKRLVAKGQKVSTVRVNYDRGTVITGYRIMKQIRGEAEPHYLPKQFKYDGTQYEQAIKDLDSLKKGDKDPKVSYYIENEETAIEGAVIKRLYFQEDLAHMLDNYLAKDRIRNGSFFGIKGRKVVDIKNQYTSIEFALSMFHAMTIGQELVSSNAAWQYERMRRDGTFSWKEMLKSYNPAQAFRETREISALLEAVLSDPKLGEDPAIKKKVAELFKTDDINVFDIITQFYGAGGLTGLDRSIQSSVHHQGDMRYKDGEASVKVVDGKAVITLPKGSKLPVWVPGPFTHLPFSGKAVTESMTEVWNQMLIEHPNHKLTAAFKTGKFGLMEGTTAWLMEQGIPRVKMAMWAREYTIRIEANSKLPKPLVKEKVARDTMKFLEDRFGEVNWQNAWMNPSFKTGLQVAFRSFTWFTGSWNALAKAGIDVGKLGWFKIKGEEYELTNRGLWAMNAILAHMMTVGLITAMYSIVALGSGGEAEDDEETPWLTKLLFPRLEPSDSQIRGAIPSYVTEWYKLLRHLGIIGTDFEPFKLISGRFNSILGKGIDVFWTNQDFRGVEIRNHADNYLSQAVDVLMHIAPLPISMSVAAKSMQSKGFSAGHILMSSTGIVSAPSSALRSKAANYAFEIRREEHSGYKSTSEQMDLKDETKRAAYAYGQGDKSKLNDMLKEQKISREQFRNALERLPLINGTKNPLYVDPLTSALHSMTIDGSLKVWEYMSEAEKKKQRPRILKKFRNMQERGYRSGEYKKEIRDKMKELKILK